MALKNLKDGVTNNFYKTLLLVSVVLIESVLFLFILFLVSEDARVSNCYLVFKEEAL